MIRVNLLPGARTATKKRFSLGLPAAPAAEGGGGAGGAGNGVSRDPWVMGAALLVLAALGTVGWLFSQVSGRPDDLRIQIEAAVRDSARYANLISQANALEAGRDTLAARVALIQEIDGARYVWPHILDEVARAVPDFTWLTQIVQTTPGAEPRFRVRGRAGNTFALTRFLSNLGDSPFIREVSLIAASQVVERDPTGREEQVQQFTIEAAYTSPPPELLQLVPLFAPGVGSGDDR